MEETQEDYIDSLSVLIPSQTVSLGQIQFGPNVSTRFKGDKDMVFEPHFTIDGIYNLDDTSGTALGLLSVDDTAGWRARVEGGVGIFRREGMRMDFKANYDGIGTSDYSSYGVSLKIVIPLK